MSPAPQMLNTGRRPPSGGGRAEAVRTSQHVDGCGFFRPRVGFQVRGYAFEALLGQGVFGRVFRVQSGESVCACKVSRLGDKYRAQCVQEAEIMKELRGKGVCPDVVDCFEEFGLFFMVMELCAQSLMSYLQRRPAGLRLPEMRLLASGLGKCLSTLRELEIMHCDVKPDNAMLLRENDLGSLRLVDFGSATRGESPHEYLQAIGYRAPEVVFGRKPYTRALDLWGAGVILFEARTGRQLFHPASNTELCLQMLCLLGTPPAELAERRFYTPAQFRFFFQHREALLRIGVAEDDQFFPEETILALALKKQN